MPITVENRPDVSIETNTSRWLAVNADYQTIIQLRRKDFNVASVINDGGETALSITGTDVTAFFTIGHSVYFESTIVGNKTAVVTNVQLVGADTLITTDCPWPVGGASDVGSYFVNLVTARPSYSAEIRLHDAGTDEVLERIDYQPFRDGRIKVDVGAWIVGYLSCDLDTTYPTTSRADENSARDFYLSWIPSYPSSIETETIDASFYYGVNAARQIGDEHGANLADYVGFDDDVAEELKALFLTVFDRPKYYPGYPFKIGFIVDAVAETEVRRGEAHYDITESLTGSDNTIIPATFDRVNYLALSGSYATNETEVRVWLETGAAVVVGGDFDSLDFDSLDFYTELG